MSHIHLITGQPLRRGATVYEGGTGTFVPFNLPSQSSPESPTVDAVALGGGYTRARPVASGDFTVGANNGVAAVVLPAPGAGKSHAIHGVDFGYSASPTGGQLTVTDGTTTFRLPVAAAGPYQQDFSPPMVFAVNSQVSGSLSAAGAGVSGYFGFTGRAIV